MISRVKLFIGGLFYEFVLILAALLGNPVERKKFYKKRIKWVPLFIIFYYIMLSYTDYVLSQNVEVIEEHLTNYDQNFDWPIQSFYHVAGSIIFFSVYMFLTLVFVGIFRTTLEIKYVLFNILFLLTHSIYNLYWHVIYIYSYEVAHMGFIFYFFLFWSGIFIQWAVDLEEDIDYKEELEDDGVRARGRTPEQRTIPMHLSLMELILALGTSAEPIETPAETRRRYNIYKRRLKEGYGDEFDYQKPSTETVSYREMLSDYRDFLYVYYGFVERIMRPFHKIYLFFEMIGKIFSTSYFYWRNGVYKRAKAVGKYEYYNPFFSLTLQHNEWDRACAQIALVEFPIMKKEWITDMENDKLAMEEMTDILTREKLRKQLDKEDKEFFEEFLIATKEVEEVIEETRHFNASFWQSISKEINESGELSTFKAKKFAQLLFTKKL